MRGAGQNYTIPLLQSPRRSRILTSTCSRSGPAPTPATPGSVTTGTSWPGAGTRGPRRGSVTRWISSQVIDGVNKYLLSPHPSSPDPNSRIRNQIGLNKAPFNNKETEFALHCFIHVAVLVSSESESWKQWRIRDNITRIFPAAMFPSSLPTTLDNVDCNTCLHKYLYIYCK